MKKVILFSLLGFAIALGFSYNFLFVNPDKAGNTVADNTFGWQFPTTKFPIVGPDSDLLAYSNIRDPGGIPEGLPIRLKIPVIGVNSAVEDALITQDGRMDVPSGSVNVAWFALGPHPGDVGSAVIGGHFGIRNGVKFVFFDLDKLRVNDKIYIENDKGETLAFQVRSIELFDRDADATNVFTSSDGLAHLNLITCEGTWNQVNGSYPQRRVIFTDAVASDGPIDVQVPITSSINPTLPVTAITPAPVPARAVSNNSNAFPQNLIPYAKSLYATPVDGIISTVLIFSIIFFLVKNIRKQS